MTLFFDLDGTLTHPHDGIVRCLQHALACAGLEPPSADDLLQYVGPPLPASFVRLLGTADEASVERAMADYRARFETTGIFENAVVPGMADVLVELVESGTRLYVVTAKPAVYAQRVLDHFELARFFDGVYGPTLASRDHTKTSLIREALAATHLAPAHVSMVGDRGEDVHGAKRNGLRAVAVSWGYGSRAELEAEGPDAILTSPRGLLEYAGSERPG